MYKNKFEPGYITMYRSGELEQKVVSLEDRLSSCDICPRECGVNRLSGEEGFCRSRFLPAVSSVCSHHGEEPVLSGTRGSGTVFFSNCNMRCIYCQNYQISQDYDQQQSREIDCYTLAERMIYLQDDMGCHNINFVSPSHFVPQMVRAVLEAVPMGLHIPLVYNSGGYDSVETLKELDGIINIYLPDLRYSSDKHATEYSQAPNYVKHARAAIKEMYRQVGNLRLDEAGLAQQGLIVRHLILPNRLAGSEDSLKWLTNEVSPDVTMSVMSQYYPAYKANQIPALSRKIKYSEYSEVVKLMNTLGINNGWLQGMKSSEYYLPDFRRESNPFERKTEV